MDRLCNRLPHYITSGFLDFPTVLVVCQKASRNSHLGQAQAQKLRCEAVPRLQGCTLPKIRDDALLPVVPDCRTCSAVTARKKRLIVRVSHQGIYTFCPPPLPCTSPTRRMYEVGFPISILYVELFCFGRDTSNYATKKLLPLPNNF